MDIKEFLDQSAGKWFSQRTNHYISDAPAQSGKSDIIVEILASDTPEVVQLCQQCNIAPVSALCGVKVNWDGIMAGEAKKQIGSTIFVPVPDSNQPNQGKILRPIGNSKQPRVVGHYIMAKDDSLTMITEDETMYTEERLWFASENLRFRTNIIKQSGGFTQTSFCSEIRMGITKPPQKVQDTPANT
ncbi:MAG: phycobiliprotein lyase [Symploca sp. SIO2E6]|nr:phycobiliprotein lyase [Symploca sp. SIO2E6]